MQPLRGSTRKFVCVHARAATSRIAVPFFFEPNYDAVIAPLPQCCERSGEPARYAPVRYGDHLFSKTSTNFA